MKKKRRISISGWLFYSMAIAVFTIAFIGLFSRQFDFKIPILSDKIYPIFDKYTVSTPGWASPGHTTEVVVGHHWVFLICLGISIVLAIIGKAISSLFIYLAEEKKKKRAAAKKKAEEKAKPSTRVSGGGSSSDSGKKSDSSADENKGQETTEKLEEKAEEPQIATETEEEKPKIKPIGQHKSMEELTRKISDIIQ